MYITTDNALLASTRGFYYIMYVIYGYKLWFLLVHCASHGVSRLPFPHRLCRPACLRVRTVRTVSFAHLCCLVAVRVVSHVCVICVFRPVLVHAVSPSLRPRRPAGRAVSFIVGRDRPSP